MEASIAAAAQPDLIDQLDYKLGLTAPYVVQRESTTTAPQTGGPFVPGGNQYIRFTLADSSALAFLDVSSVRLSFELVNLAPATGTDLTMLATAHALFQRAQLHIRGTLCEDLMFYSRQCHLKRFLLADRNKVKDDALEAPYTDGNNAITVTIPKNNGIQRFSIPLDFGYFQSQKHHYFGAGALSITLQLANQADAFRGAAQSPWQLQNVVLLSDVVRVTPDYASGYSQQLLTGGRILTAFSSMQSMQFEVPNATTMSVSISRAFTRIKAIYISFEGPQNDNFKAANQFYCPNPTAAQDNSANPPEIYCQLGTITTPTIPLRGSQQAFYHLRRALGYCGGGSTNIFSQATYLASQWVTAITFERARTCNDMGGGVSFSGMSSQAGELLRVYVRNLPTDGTKPTYIWIHIHHDQINEVRGDGVTVLV